jgi:hypothetical protein
VNQELMNAEFSISRANHELPKKPSITPTKMTGGGGLQLDFDTGSAGEAQ